MQENPTNIPAWLKPGNFIDLKDKQGDWRVAYILNITKTQIRVRYDGWSSKFDENYPINSSNLRPFRSVIRGYTGQTENPPPREHYKFSQGHHRQHYETVLTEFLQQLGTKSEWEINQFIRGEHYTWIEFLMTGTYGTKGQIQLVFEYFFKHFQLVMKYLGDLVDSKSFQDWINGLDKHGLYAEPRRAFADSYYQIFDSVYAILEGYPRLRGFFKNNAALITQFISKNNYLEFMSQYISTIGLIQLFQQTLSKLSSDKTSKIPLNFTTALTRLFSALQKTIHQKQKRKQLAQKICQYILRECSKLTDISIKEEELEIQKIYSTCKMFLLKYSWKVEFLVKFQIVNIHCWKCMILSEKLQRKIKAINCLRVYLSNLANAQKKQMMLIYNSRETIQQELGKQQILRAIFYENEHHQIIKKGCELVTEMHRDKLIGMKELELVWKSCRHRLEAVRKIMYGFFQDICKDLSKDELQILLNHILAEDFAEQIDKTFFYNFFKRIMENATQQKSQLIQKLFDIVEKRLPNNRDQIKIFSQLLTMKKSFKLGFIQKISNKIIYLISQQKNDQVCIFYLGLANHIFTECGKSKFEIGNEAFTIVFQILCEVLKTKIRKEQLEMYKNKKEKIYFLLRIIEYLETHFDFQPEEFIQMWELFNQEQNREFRETQFLPWVLHISYKGLYKLQTLQINKCLTQKQLKKQIFTKILRKHPSLDYISLSQIQFKIFKKFMLSVNVDMGNIREQTNFLTGITFFRILDKYQGIQGIKELFDIFLNCRNQGVVQKAAKLLNQMHFNYQVGEEGTCERAKKMEELLFKIQRYINDGMKRSNIRLVKNALFMLADLSTIVKESYPMPAEYKFNTQGFRVSKKNITIKSAQDTILKKQLQVVMISPIKTLKKRICEQLKVPFHNIRLFKQLYQYKKIDENGSYDDASASSAQSYDNSKSSNNYNMVKKVTLEEIPYQVLYAPVTSLMLPENGPVIVAKHVNNAIYDNIQRFANEKIADSLLKILADPDYYSKQSSQLAYTILLQISCSVSSTQQILNNLITQLTLKNKSSPEQNKNSIGLCHQSINFKMYFCRNINKLDMQQLQQLLSQKNSHIHSDIFTQLQKQITSPLQIQLLLQILHLIKKCLSKSLITPAMLPPNLLYSCIVNVLEFNAGLKETKEYRKDDRAGQIKSQLCVFMDCFTGLEAVLGDFVAEFVIQHHLFPKIMTIMFQTLYRSQFSEMFQTKMAHYFKTQKKLTPKSEQIMYDTIFNKLYSPVTKLHRKTNSSFFKLTRDLILISSPGAISTLFNTNTSNTNTNQQCFWQTCLQVISNQSDSYNQACKQNKLLSGHLVILDALIRKYPEAVTEGVCRMLLFSCLCYREGETIGNNVKCVSKNSIQAVLMVLSTLIKTHEKYAMLIISELRKYQQTKYWRTPEFWNVSIQLQMKSPCGYVGLENPGCICYLNSFTQILFMNQQFRRQVVNFSASDPTKDYSLLHQLQKIFLNLQFSNKKYLNPVPFTKTIKTADDKPMIKLFQQMDIEEYSSILFDKIQKLLPKDQDFVKDIFGGTYSNDIISKECKHCSQREESFLSMQLDVKANLEESLKTLVKGELLEGQNAYYCQKCNKKVKALKRMSIKKLPNNLIICLKRFEYNFETDQKFKINSCCEFPRQMTLQPYSQQFLSSEQQLKQFNQKQGETVEIQRLAHEYFEYKLKGVIIHTGSSESGHYYALIQSSTDPQKWLQFNDSLVTDFDIDNLPDQAFGSDDPSFSKYKNAYMLIYQRKNKIPPKMPQIPSLSPQSTKTLQQITTINKQIQAFHTIFTPEYNHFMSEIVKHTINTNYMLRSQYKTVIKELNPGLSLGSFGENGEIQMVLGSKTLGSVEFVQEIMKYYGEFCLFVKAREINLHSFIEYLYELDCLLSTPILRGVLDYFLRELCQQLLVQQLFMQASFRDKLIILSNFTAELILKRLKQKQSLSDEIDKLILQMVQTFTIVIIKEGYCCNELIYIIRRIADEFPYFVPYFERMNLFEYFFQILGGIYQSVEEKGSKVVRLRDQVARIISECFGGENQMEQEITQKQELKFEIQTVEKSGKCILRQQSPQQAWNYLYIMYRHQSKLIADSNQISEQGKQQSMLGQIARFKREVFMTQFLKLKNSRYDFMIRQCQGSKAARSVSLFLCEVMHDNEEITQRFLACILKELRAEEAVNFRNHLVLLYYMVMHDDNLTFARIQDAIKMLINALVEKNSKYFSETDIIHQWIMKLMLNSQQFLNIMNKSQVGLQLYNQIFERIEVLKKPSSQLLKKQKNPNYQRLNYIIHGIQVSPQQKDYQLLHQLKKTFFTKQFHEQPLGQLSPKLQSYRIKQPTYLELTHKIQLGEILYILSQRKWVRVVVRSVRYGFIRVSRLVRDGKEGKDGKDGKDGKEGGGQGLGNFVEIYGVKVDIGAGFRMCQEEFSLWEMEEKLACVSLDDLLKQTADIKQPKYSSPVGLRNQANDGDSNISYQSSH